MRQGARAKSRRRSAKGACATPRGGTHLVDVLDHLLPLALRDELEAPGAGVAGVKVAWFGQVGRGSK